MERWPSPARGERTSAVDSGGDWNALLAQYGQAMLRLGQLEKEVGDLQQRLQETQPGNGKGELDAALKEKEEELSRRGDLVASLRLQVASLNAELAQTQEKLKLAADGRYVRRRHRHHRPWWKLWDSRR